MKQIFQLRETNREVRNQYKRNQSIRLVIVKKLQDIMGLKSGSPFFFVLRLVKILRNSKTLSKIEKIVHAVVGCVRVELN